MIIVLINMLIAQYPIQFSGPSRNISNSCLALWVHGGSTTVAFQV